MNTVGIELLTAISGGVMLCLIVTLGFFIYHGRYKGE